MQPPSVFESSPLGTRLPPKESVASSQASQRNWPKPSETKVGDTFYRYEATLTSSGVDEFDEPVGPGFMSVWVRTFTVESVTPKGAVIFAPCGPEENHGMRRVMDHHINKYAYPSKGEALLGFIARKKRQQAIISGQYFRSREAESAAERLLAQELKKC